MEKFGMTQSCSTCPSPFRICVCICLVSFDESIDPICGRHSFLIRWLSANAQQQTYYKVLDIWPGHYTTTLCTFFCLANAIVKLCGNRMCNLLHSSALKTNSETWMEEKWFNRSSVTQIVRLNILISTS